MSDESVDQAETKSSEAGAAPAPDPAESAASGASAAPAPGDPPAADPGAEPKLADPYAPEQAPKPAKTKPKSKRKAARKSGFSTRNVVVFGILVVGLVAAFGLVGNRGDGGPINAWRLKLNQPVNVEITLVTSDANDLGCAMDGEVAGLHCAFLAQNKKNDKAGSSREDGKLLQPYATVDHRNFLAAGVWLQPETKDAGALQRTVEAMPNPRFSFKCTFTPKGRAKAAKVQWHPGNDWGPGDDWYVGTVSGCKLAK